VKDLGLAIGMGAITLLPFAVLSGLAIGGMYAFKKLKEKPDRVARISGEVGVEAEWPNLQDFEVEF
jgi:hypothetical protein